MNAMLAMSCPLRCSRFYFAWSNTSSSAPIPAKYGATSRLTYDLIAGVVVTVIGGLMFVPAFRVKADVIPGRYVSIWFRATKPGRYHLFCAEYCGTKHSGMIGKIVGCTEDSQCSVAEKFVHMATGIDDGAVDPCGRAAQPGGT